eukprot:g2770.t1
MEVIEDTKENDEVPEDETSDVDVAASSASQTVDRSEVSTSFSEQAEEDSQQSIQEDTGGEDENYAGPNGELSVGQTGWTIHAAENGKQYWHNSNTGASVWDEPPECLQYRRATSVNGWNVHPAPDGRPYWHNSHTKVSVWIEPPEMKEKRLEYIHTVPSSRQNDNVAQGEETDNLLLHAQKEKQADEAAFDADMDRIEAEHQAKKAKARAEVAAAKREMEQFQKQEDAGLDKLRQEIEEMKARAARYDLANETSSADEAAAALLNIQPAAAPLLGRDIAGQNNKMAQGEVEAATAKSETARLKQKHVEDMDKLRLEEASSFAKQQSEASPTSKDPQKDEKQSKSRVSFFSNSMNFEDNLDDAQNKKAASTSVSKKSRPSLISSSMDLDTKVFDGSEAHNSSGHFFGSFYQDGEAEQAAGATALSSSNHAGNFFGGTAVTGNKNVQGGDIFDSFGGGGEGNLAPTRSLSQILGTSSSTSSGSQNAKRGSIFNFEL